MPLKIPNLDDRTFQQLVDEARRRIPHYSPDWTDHNLSDPGITLLELFATMVETLIYRLNRVPEKSYITFLNLMGVRLQPAAPAKVGLTFWLSQALRAANSTLPIPAGFEVAIQQTGAEQSSISFMTDAEQKVNPFTPTAFLSGPGGADTTIFQTQGKFLDQAVSQDQPAGKFTFAKLPQAVDHIYVGVANDIGGHIVTLTLAGVETKLAGWQAWCGDKDGWQPVDLVTLEEKPPDEPVPAFQLPTDMAELSILSTMNTNPNGTVIKAYWLRVPGARLATQTSTLTVATLGITVPATHATPISYEVIGRSNGQPRQTFRLAYAPVLPLLPLAKEPEILEVQKEPENLEVQNGKVCWDPWTCVEHFGASQATDRHYTLDLASGEVAFGPLIREPDGSERQYGAIPPQGRVIRFRRYRSGGGVAGNVGAKTLKVMKGTLLEGVARVENRAPAAGGKDGETIERAALRAPDVLRTGERAVTAEDFERLAIAVPNGNIGRAYCVSGEEEKRLMENTSTVQLPSNAVLLLLTPACEQVDRYILEEELQLHTYQRESVKEYLDERKLLTTQLLFQQPKYKKVTVEAVLNRGDETSRDEVEQKAKQRLYQYLNPLTGGPDGKGWPFGRSLFISEVYAILQRVSGVNYVEKLKFPQGAEFPQETTIAWNELIISGIHNITAP